MPDTQPIPVPNITEAEFVPITEADAVAEMTVLVKRIERSRLNPLTIATRAGLKGFVSWLDGIMATVENSIGNGKKG